MSLLMACSNTKKDPLQGQRETVLFDSTMIVPDIKPVNHTVILPQAHLIQDWPVVGGNIAHDVPVAQLNMNMTQAWSKSIGAGSSGQARLLNGPIAYNNIIYTIDTQGLVTATTLEDGRTLWQTTTHNDTKSGQEFSGGLAYANGLIFCATSSAQIVIIDAKSGEVIKQLMLTAPARAAPIVDKNHVYAITINNQIEVFNYETGEPIWSHQGMLESAGLLGGATPALAQQTIIVPYTSGEVYALNKTNGSVMWSESLTDTQRLDPVSTIFHIKARPVIKGDTVYLISHGEITKAVNLATGAILWQHPLGGVRSPALAGDYLFMVTNAQKLICLDRHNGKIIWTHQLRAFEDFETKKQPVLWAGPLMTSQGCLLVNSIGQFITVSVQDGQILQTVETKQPYLLSPIIVSQTLILLSDNGELVAYR